MPNMAFSMEDPRGILRKVLLLLGLSMIREMLFASLVWAHEDGEAITARGTDTLPLNPDGTI